MLMIINQLLTKLAFFSKTTSTISNKPLKSSAWLTKRSEKYYHHPKFFDNTTPSFVESTTQLRGDQEPPKDDLILSVYLKDVSQTQNSDEIDNSYPLNRHWNNKTRLFDSFKSKYHIFSTSDHFAYNHRGGG